MPCVSLASKLSNACTSGIAKIQSRQQLLQIIAGVICSKSSSDPYNGNLVYVRVDGTTVSEANPVGARNLNFGANKVVAIHAHNCPLLTSITCTGNANLVTIDLQNCATLKTLDFNNCTALPSFSLDTFTSLTSLNLNNCTNLSSGTMGFAALQTLGGATFTASTITKLIFPVLTSITTTGIDVGSGPLNTLTAPVLASITGNANFSQSKMTAVSLPALTTVSSGYLLFNSTNTITSISLPLLQSVSSLLYMQDLANCTTIDCHSLVSADSIYIDRDVNLTSVNFSSVQTIINNFSAFQCTLLNSINFPSLVAVPPGVDLNTSPALTFFGWNSLPFPDGITFNGVNCAFSLAVVNAVLAAGVAGGISANVIDVSGGTSAIPTGGAANPDYLTLVGAGVTVGINT